MNSYYWKTKTNKQTNKQTYTTTQLKKQASEQTNGKIILELETTLPISLVLNWKNRLEIPKGYLEGTKSVGRGYQRGNQKVSKGQLEGTKE